MTADPAGSIPGSIGYQPNLVGNMPAGAYFLGWLTTEPIGETVKIHPAQMLEAGLPASFSALTVGSTTTTTPTLQIRGSGAGDSGIEWWAGAIRRASVSLASTGRMRYRMWNTSGGGVYTFADMRYAGGTYADPHRIVVGPDSAAGSPAIQLDVGGGEVKARTFLSYLTDQALSGSNPIQKITNFSASASGTTALTGPREFFTFSLVDTVQGAANLTNVIIGSLPGVDATGGRAALIASMARNSPIDPGIADESDGSSAFSAHATAAANLGGVASGFGVTPNFGSGLIYGSNVYLGARNGATYLRTLENEWDFEIDATSSSSSMIGILVSHAGAHEYQPPFRHSFIQLGDQAVGTFGGQAAYGWKQVILVGGAQWAMMPQAVVFQLEVPSGNSVIPSDLAGMLDGLHGTFNGTARGGGPYFVRAPGFQVVPSTTTGATAQLGYAKWSSTSTGATLDVNQAQLTGIAVLAGGTNWNGGVYGEDTLGNVVRVTTVGMGGVVTAATIYRGGWVDAATAPATLSFTGVGGGGLGLTGFTATPTWTARTKLTVNPSGITYIAGGQQVLTRVVTAAGAVTVSGTLDQVVVVNKTVGAATTVNLPATPATGLMVVIKDGKGDAGANNITITPAAGNIDGAGTLVINANYGKAALVYNGAEWSTI